MGGNRWGYRRFSYNLHYYQMGDVLYLNSLLPDGRCVVSQFTSTEWSNCGLLSVVDEIGQQQRWLNGWCGWINEFPFGLVCQLAAAARYISYPYF